MTDRLAQSAKRLRDDPALGEVVRAIGIGLQAEVMAFGPRDERGNQAWLEYEALQRVVAAIDQLAQDAVKEDSTNA